LSAVDVSVNVCTFNRADSLREALWSLVSQANDGSFSYEIVVTDDGSTDHTCDVVREVAEATTIPVRYVRRDEGGGVAEARNSCLVHSRGRWIAFFDDDQLADPRWLERLLRVAKAERADCVGGTRLLKLPPGVRAELGPTARRILGEYVYLREAVRFRGKHLPATGNLLVDRRVFDTIGAFDTTMHYGGEDSEFITRARSADFVIWVVPDAIVHHVIPPERLERLYLRWVALRWGGQSAQIDSKHLGNRKMSALCAARVGQAALVNVPGLLFAGLRRDAAAAADRAILLWRALGYFRQTLFLLAPTFFAQERYRASLLFRQKPPKPPRGRSSGCARW